MTASGAGSSGIVAIGAGNTSVTSTTVTAAGTGILANSTAGTSTVTSGNVTSGGPGIVAGGAGAVSVTSTGTVATTGANGGGISAVSTAGAVTVNSATVTTAGANSRGIFAQGAGNVSVTSGNVTTAGANSSAIVALATGAGTASVTSSGTVSTSGANSNGVVASSATGAATVDVNAISVTGTGTGQGVMINSGTTGTVTIRGLVQSANGFEVFATGGATTVNTTATGIIRGQVSMTGNNDIVNNAGRFDAVVDSDFGAGTDVFNNTGLVTSFSGAARFLGLETFNNLATGRIDMRDNAVGDTLTLGNYVGTTGSRLQLDVNLSTNLADVLITGAATGSSILDVNLLGSLVINTTGTLVVDGTAGTSASAFTLAGGLISTPFVTVNLIFDAPNNNFLLVGSPQAPVFETLEQAEMVTNFWYDSADAITAQLEAARDGTVPVGTVQTNNLVGDGRFGGWVQGVAGNTDREAVNGFGNAVFDTSYQQDYLGVQAGLDYQAGGTIIGVSFGYGKSDAEFDVTFNRVEMTGYNLGAYVAFQSGGFFLNAIAKVDWIDVDSTLGAGVLAEFDANVWGLRSTLATRFHSGNVFFEPSVTLSYVNADIDNYTVAGAAG